MLSIIDGFKSYALGVVLIVIGALELIGVDVVPNIDQSNAWTAGILAGWGVIAARSAVAKIT